MTGQPTKTQIKATNSRAKVPTVFTPKFWEQVDKRLRGFQGQTLFVVPASRNNN